MTRIGSLSRLTLLAAVASAPALSADVIQKVDGERIAGVEVQEEGLEQVAYQKDGRQATVPSDQVERVVYASASYPRGLADAAGALADDDVLAAYEEFDSYVEQEISGGRERKKWAPAYAAWQTVELAGRLGDMEAVSANAARLVKNYPLSRYAPHALVAKAGAELDRKDSAAAQRTLQDLETFVGEHGLSDRWKLTGEWMGVMADPRSTPDARRRALRDIARRAEAFPLVATRAKVAEGETYIAEADDKTDPAAAQELRKQAQAIFEEAVAGPADPAALAAAHAGIGESLYYEGAAKGDDQILVRAADQFLRVIVLYPGESRYVPRSYFFAMRCYDLVGDRRRAAEMRVELTRQYPDSPWTAEAEKFKPSR